ncbi:MAG: YcxB family protein [Bacteroidota bacterium]
MEPITVKSKLNLKTYYQLSLLVHYRTRQLVSMLIVFVCLNVLMFTDDNLSLGSEMICIGVVVLLYGVVTPLRIWFISKRNMRTSPVLLDGITYYITDEGIEGISTESSAKTSWKLIQKAVEKENYFLLFSSPVLFRYLPKDGFGSEDDITRFKEIVKTNRIKAYFK